MCLLTCDDIYSDSYSCGMDFYKSPAVELPDLPMEVVINIIKKMWQQLDREEGAKRVFGPMGEPVGLIPYEDNGHKQGEACYLMTEAQNALFKNHNGKIANAITSNYIRMEDDHWNDGAINIGWRPWDTYGAIKSIQRHPIIPDRLCPRRPWTEEQKEKWRVREGIPSQNLPRTGNYLDYQKDTWQHRESLLGSKKTYFAPPAKHTQRTLPDWLPYSDGYDTETPGCYTGPTFLVGGGKTARLGCGLRDLPQWTHQFFRHKGGNKADGCHTGRPKDEIMWLAERHMGNSDVPTAKKNLKAFHGTMKELINTVPIVMTDEDCKIIDQKLQSIAKEQEDPETAVVWSGSGRSIHWWAERGLAWIKLWSRVIDYKRVGNRIEWRYINRQKVDHDFGLGVPKTLGAIKKSKAKYKKIK